ncbi:MAG: porin family protein [Alphaproteobacteria bacterium]|nr:porin family protein [Alphaproteobacteria bacterium]
MKNTIGALMVAVSAIALSTTAEAKEINIHDFKPYVGFDYAYTTTSVKNVARPYYNSGKLSVGTDYSQYFGTELFFQYSDKYKKSGYSNRFQAYGLDLYGYLPIKLETLGLHTNFSLIGTGGFGFYTLTSKTHITSKEHDHGYGFRLGTGIQYDINEQVAVRALFRQIQTDQIDHVNHFAEYSLGVKYSF